MGSLREGSVSHISSRYAGAFYLRKHFSSARFAWLLFFGWVAGRIFTKMVPALFVARILSTVQSGSIRWEDNRVSFFAAVCSVVFGEIILRITLHFQSVLLVRVSDQILVESHRRLLDKSLSFHADSFAGDLTSKVNKLSVNFILFLDSIYFQIASFVGVLVFSMFVLGAENFFAVCVYVVVMILYVLVAGPLIRFRVKLVEKRSRMESVRTGLLVDSLANVLAVKSFAREGSESDRFREHVEETGRLTLRSWLYSTWGVDSLTVVFYSLMVFGPLASIFLFSDIVELDQLFLVYTFLALLGAYIWDFALVWRNVEVQLAEAAEALEIIEAPEEVVDLSEAVPFEAKHGAIFFDDMCFSYHSADQLFNNFSLSIEPGQKVGLVGTSGGGKTTFVKLLLRFMDIQDGQICLDGIPLSSMSQQSLRRAIAYIPQEPVLFHRSIRENILYGRPDASETELVEAARKAHAHDFISVLPDGYDTLVGERGVKLSGGQRQRVAIARAFLKPAKILILDEATSALDSESELLIQAALSELFVDKTVVSIAHRLSTLQCMDRLLVMQSGAVIEDGSHRELLDSDGVYAQLWQHQSGGYV